MIPKIFHRIWLDEPIPRSLQRNWKAFKNLHPDWEFNTVASIKDVQWIQNKDMLDHVEKIAGRTDIIRYELLYKFGGVYVDCDVVPLRPFDELLEYDMPFIGWEDDKRLCPTVIGSPAKHPAIQELLEFLPQRVKNQLAKKVTNPVSVTGPVYITNRWRKRDDVVRLPMWYFYPVGYEERHLVDKGLHHPDSFALHQWRAGWKSDKAATKNEPAEPVAPEHNSKKFTIGGVEYTRP